MSTDVADGAKTSKPVPHPLSFFIRVLLVPSLLGALLTTALFYVPVAGWSTNDVTTGEHPGYPDLKPCRYDASPTNTLQYAAAAASGIRNWKVTGRDENTGTLRVEVTTALPLFTDDVLVTVTPTGKNNDSSLVMIRSHSRVGRADLGENARHIHALQTAMDQRLPALER